MFRCYSENIFSKKYALNFIKTPLIQNLDIDVDYPAYTKKIDEKITNTGNLVVPVGTKIKWNVNTYQSNNVAFTENNKIDYFTRTSKNKFKHKKVALNNFDYQISVSNKELQDFEKISYNLKVIKDEYPSIIAQSNIDSVNVENAQFIGQVSDDYGINSLELIYYQQDLPTQENSISLKITNATTQTFNYRFPEEIIFKRGVGY